jgi:oligoribonuclease NrnB/cAMP/cGMP phosphodiesterase (DHH superfamily)
VDNSTPTHEFTGGSPVVQEKHPTAVQGGGMNDERALRELKATILSMDWEITDEVMARLIEQIGQVKVEYGEDRNIFILLKVLGTVGNYIKVNKGRAHPNAINLIKSVYSGVERLALEPNLDETQSKRIVLTEIKSFKALKAQVSTDGTSASATSANHTSGPRTDVSAGEGYTDQQMDSIRALVADVVRQELAKFKDELLANLNRR